MRIFMMKALETVKTWLALLLAACLIFFFVCSRASAFPFLKGERTYYLYSSSSQAKIVDKYSLSEAFSVRGESVRLKVESEEKLVEGILERLSAKSLFTECVEGVTSYYCYTEKLGGGVTINGRTINLHIAVKNQVAVVGTPIIFGGY